MGNQNTSQRNATSNQGKGTLSKDEDSESLYTTSPEATTLRSTSILSNGESESVVSLNVPIATHVGFFYAQKLSKIITLFRTTVQIYDFQDGKVHWLPIPMVKKVSINCATFVESKDLLITGDDDGKIRLYKVDTDSYVFSSQHKASTGVFIRIIQDPAECAPAEEPKEMDNMRDKKTLQQKLMSLMDQKGHTSEITCILSMDNDRIAAYDTEGVIHIYSTNDEEVHSVLTINTFQLSSTNVIKLPTTVVRVIISMAWEPLRQFFYCGTPSGKIVVISLETRTVAMEIDLGDDKIAVISLVVAPHSDALVGISSDEHIRVWNLDTGKTIAAYKLPATCLCYDETRDVVFTGGSDSMLTLSKVVTNINSTSAEIRVIKKAHSSHGAILGLYYHGESDTLVTLTATGQMECWYNATGVAYPVMEGGTTQHMKRLTSEIIDGILHEFTGAPINLSHPRLEKEKKLLELSLELIEEPGEDAKARKEALLDEFGNVIGNFAKSLTAIKEEVAMDTQSLSQNYTVILNPDQNISKLEEQLAAEEAELRAKWEREWQEFQRQAELRRKNLKDKITLSRRQVASQLLSLQRKAMEQQNSVEKEASTALKKFIARSFPIIQGTYQIGQPLSFDAHSVFKGLDRQRAEFVAIKVFPSNVSLDTSLKHEALVPIIDVCTTETEGTGTTFVIMKLMKETLMSYVKRQPGQQVEVAKAAQIMYILLKCVAYLHSKRMVVRDLSPQHILMNEEGFPHLLHLGVMRSLQGTVEGEEPEDGKIFAAPELFCRVVKGSSDIWSLGMIFMYLLQTPTERAAPLFTGTDVRAVLKSIVHVTGRPTIDELTKMGDYCKMDEEGIELLKYVADLPAEEHETKVNLRDVCHLGTPLALDLLSKMMTFLPDRRINAVDALHHPFFLKEQNLHLAPECDLQPNTDLTSQSIGSDGSESELSEDKSDNE